MKEKFDKIGANRWRSKHSQILQDGEKFLWLVKDSSGIVQHGVEPSFVAATKTIEETKQK